MRPKVSVNLVVWKPKREWLDEAIQSLRDQTYKNVEIVIAQLEGDKPIKYNGIKVVKVKPRIEPPHFFNIYHQKMAAIEATDAKYITAIGYDDIYYPEKIEKEVEALESVDGVCAYSGVEYWDEKMENKIYEDPLPDFKLPIIFNRQINDLALIRNDYARYDTDFGRYSAWKNFLDIVVDLAKKGELHKVVRVDQMGFKYRQHRDGIHSKVLRGSKTDWWWKNNQIEYARFMEYLSRQKRELEEGGFWDAGETEVSSTVGDDSSQGVGAEEVQGESGLQGHTENKTGTD